MIIKREGNQRYELIMSVMTNTTFRIFMVTAHDLVNAYNHVVYHKVVSRRKFGNQHTALSEARRKFDGMNKLLSGVAA
ncbi:MAG: hypothetical protein MJZ99_06965 [Bacteroidales bacterium]|nr:hypothetical protein [Bacteroidales bacterium]